MTPARRRGNGPPGLIELPLGLVEQPTGMDRAAVRRQPGGEGLGSRGDQEEQIAQGGQLAEPSWYREMSQWPSDFVSWKT